MCAVLSRSPLISVWIACCLLLQVVLRYEGHGERREAGRDLGCLHWELAGVGLEESEAGQHPARKVHDTVVLRLPDIICTTVLR